MPRKKAKGRAKNKAFDAKRFVIAITLLSLVLVSVALISFFSGSGVSGMATKSGANEQTSGIKIYDINVPGSFFTFRNMGKSPIESGDIVISINKEHAICTENIGQLNPDQLALCTSPLVKICRTIEVETPLGNDTAKCE